MSYVFCSFLLAWGTDIRKKPLSTRPNKLPLLALSSDQSTGTSKIKKKKQTPFYWVSRIPNGGKGFKLNFLAIL